MRRNASVRHDKCLTIRHHLDVVGADPPRRKLTNPRIATSCIPDANNPTASVEVILGREEQLPIHRKGLVFIGMSARWRGKVRLFSTRNAIEDNGVGSWSPRESHGFCQGGVRGSCVATGKHRKFKSNLTLSVHSTKHESAIGFQARRQKRGAACIGPCRFGCQTSS